MASGGEVGGTLFDNIGSEDLDDVKCQPCQDDGEILEAVGMCTDCQEYLCQRCFDGHKLPRPMRNHQLLNKHEMMQSQNQPTRKDKCTIRCPKHADKNVKYYCTTHDKLNCSVCLNLDHRACKGVIYIPDVADDLDNNEEFKKADDHISALLARFREAADIAEQNLEALDGSYTEALEMIRVFRKEINDAIDAIEREILEKASEMKSTEMKEMDRTVEERTRVEKEMKAEVARVEAFRKLNQNCNLFTEMMKIKAKLDNFDDELKTIERKQSCGKTGIKFTPNTEILESLKQTDAFGKLTVTGTRGQIQDGVSPVANTSTINKAEHSHNINVKCGDDQRKCWITGSVILPDHRLLIVDYNNNKVKAVDVQQCYVSSHLTLSSRPWDIVVINNNQIAVTLPEEKKVDLATTEGTLAVQRSLQLKGQCWGIDYRGDKLAVSFISPDQIQIIDLQGTVLHTIEPYKQGVTAFQTPYYTRFNRDSTALYVSSTDSEEVVCVRLDGTVVGSYTDNALRSLRGIMLDRCGHIYVCVAGVNNIHRLTPDCKKSKVLLTRKNGIHMPFTVSFSESEKKMYVGMEKCNSVKVYKATLG